VVLAPTVCQCFSFARLACGAGVSTALGPVLFYCLSATVSFKPGFMVCKQLFNDIHTEVHDVRMWEASWVQFGFYSAPIFSQTTCTGVVYAWYPAFLGISATAIDRGLENDF